MGSRIANVFTQSVCPFKEAINLNDVEFHTFIVLSIEPEIIFSFEGIITNALTKSVCPVKVAINVESYQLF